MVCLSVHSSWGQNGDKAGKGGISSVFNSCVHEKQNQCQLASPHSHISKDEEHEG
jgi:hypothetical protein